MTRPIRSLIAQTTRRPSLPAATRVGANLAGLAVYAVAAAVIACMGAQSALAQEAPAASIVAPTEVTLASGVFTKKSFKIDGGWSVVTRADGVRVVRFNEAFSTRDAPDLKVFLSPANVADLNGRTATGGAVLLGALSSVVGAQEYEIPTDVELSDYASILVHCEAYSKLWGGADL